VSPSRRRRMRRSSSVASAPIRSVRSHRARLGRRGRAGRDGRTAHAIRHRSVASAAARPHVKIGIVQWLAATCGRDHRMSEIVNGRRSIAADTALRLARYFDMTPQFWMNLQAAYDLDSGDARVGGANQTRRARGCIAAYPDQCARVCDPGHSLPPPRSSRCVTAPDAVYPLHCCVARP
jgi:addiction module HigA family antidote